VTEVPADPPVGDKLLMFGETVKALPLLSTALACTTTLPVVAPGGTGTPILPGLQLAGVAAVPLNFTVLVPWLVPKFAPVTVTDAPTAPDAGDRLVILGAGSTVKLTPLLALLETVTTTLPVEAPIGTVTTMLVALQLLVVAVVPLNLTVLVPFVDPKFEPVIVTDAPTAPDVGDKLEMVGAAARATPAKKKKNDTEKKRIGFQSRMFIRTSLQGSVVWADQNSAPVTIGKQSPAIVAALN